MPSKFSSHLSSFINYNKCTPSCTRRALPSFFISSLLLSCAFTKATPNDKFACEPKFRDHVYSWIAYTSCTWIDTRRAKTVISHMFPASSYCTRTHKIITISDSHSLLYIHTYFSVHTNPYHNTIPILFLPPPCDISNVTSFYCFSPCKKAWKHNITYHPTSLTIPQA